MSGSCRNVAWVVGLLEKTLLSLLAGLHSLVYSFLRRRCKGRCWRWYWKNFVNQSVVDKNVVQKRLVPKWVACKVGTDDVTRGGLLLCVKTYKKNWFQSNILATFRCLIHLMEWSLLWLFLFSCFYFFYGHSLLKIKKKDLCTKLPWTHPPTI